MSEQFEIDQKRLEKYKSELEKDGFFGLKVIEGRGICGLMKFIFTVGLVEGIATNGFDFYDGRYCYAHKHAIEAVMALAVWDGKEDPEGNWIKYKGRRGEYSNPKSVESYERG